MVAFDSPLLALTLQVKMHLEIKQISFTETDHFLNLDSQKNRILSINLEEVGYHFASILSMSSYFNQKSKNVLITQSTTVGKITNSNMKLDHTKLR